MVKQTPNNGHMRYFRIIPKRESRNYNGNKAIKAHIFNVGCPGRPQQKIQIGEILI